PSLLAAEANDAAARIPAATSSNVFFILSPPLTINNLTSNYNVDIPLAPPIQQKKDQFAPVLFYYMSVRGRRLSCIVSFQHLKLHITACRSLQFHGALGTILKTIHAQIEEEYMFFPQFRARRIRGKEVFSRMVRETTLSVNDLVYPMFSAFGTGIKKEVSSMPGIYQQSIEHIVAEAKEVYDLGIPAVLLFGIPETKDAVGSDAYCDTGIIQETIRAIKREVPGLAVITDVCMCEYTDHGHCGIIKDGDVDNDST